MPAARASSALGACDVDGHVGVEHGTHRCSQPLHHGHVKAAFEQPFRDLQSDVAGTDHHRAPRTCDKQPFHFSRVVERAQLHRPLRVDTWPFRRDARRAGADQQFVIVLRRLPARIEVTHGHGGGPDVDGSDFVTGPHVDALGTVLLRGAGDEAVRRLYEPADQVGKAAGGVGSSGRALEDHYFKLGNSLHPSYLCRCRHARCIAADDHQSSCHFPDPGLLRWDSPTAVERNRVSAHSTSTSVRLRTVGLTMTAQPSIEPIRP